MPSTRRVGLQFPVGGYSRRFGYQAQPPFTAAEMLNVRPDDADEQRLRGGSRPGTVKAFPQQLGGEINMLQSLRYSVAGTTGQQPRQREWSDPFTGNGPPGPDWRHVFWPAIFNYRQGYPDWAQSGSALQFYVDITDPGFDDHADTWATDLDLDLNWNKKVEYRTTGSLRTQAGATAEYHWFCFLDKTDPQPRTDSLWLQLIWWQDPAPPFDCHVGWHLKIFVGESIRVSYNPTTITVPNDGSSRINTDMTVTFDPEAANNIRIATDEGHAAPFLYENNFNLWPTAKYQFGIGARAFKNTYFGGMFCHAILADVFLRYYDTGTIGVPTAKGRLLIAGSGGEAYAGDEPAQTLDVINRYENVEPLEDDRPLAAVERGQQVFIADAQLNRITTEQYYHRVAWNTVTNDWMVFDYHAQPSGGQTGGTIPKLCRAIGVYKDRIVLAADPAYPHLWYMSASGNPFWWNFSLEDPVFNSKAISSAVSGSSYVTISGASVGQPITSIIPYSQDYLLFGCEESIYMLDGDPEFENGRMRVLTYATGVLSPFSWTHGPNGEVYFLSTTGLYMIPFYGGLEQSAPEAMTRERFPRELLGIDPETNYASLTYDPRFNGVEIHVTSLTGTGGGVHYFYDLSTRSYWPYSMMGNQAPWSSILYDPGQRPEMSSEIMGSRDGYIRRKSRLSATDDTASIPSHVLYGPIRMGQDGVHYGALTELDAVLGSDSGDVDWEVLAAMSAEQALARQPVATGTWKAGENATVRLRAIGDAFYLRLRGAESQHWTVERIVAGVQSMGRIRRGLVG